MLRWRIGDVTVTRVVEMEIPVPYNPKRAFLKEATPEALAAIPWLAPDYVTPEGHLRLSIHAPHIWQARLLLLTWTLLPNARLSI